MRRTKIVCTLGPSTDAPGILREMALAGMNVARFNFSHGTHDEQLRRLTALKALREELNLPIAALLDTKGPEIRLGTFKEGKIHLDEDDIFTLTTREIEGDKQKATVTYKNLYQDVSVGSRVLIDDGKIEMIVQEIKGEDIVCKVKNHGPVSNRKSINVPGVQLSLPYLSTVDKNDILFGIKQGFDIIAASFTRSARDIQDIRNFLEDNGGEHMIIIAKIENQDGVTNIEEILSASNGIMIARGDMGVEIDFAEIPIIQKRLIEHCYNSGRPAITATQMLESMMSNPRPTRAEITDVANAIYDGTSAIMLSGETAAGKYPVETVRTMATIAERTESSINYHQLFKLQHTEGKLSVAEAVSHATCTTAMDTGANAIVTVTQSGETARLLCKYRPSTPICACVTDEYVERQLSLSWGISPMMMPIASSTDELISLSVETAQKARLVHEGDLVVITAGVPVGVSGTTNMMKTHLVGDVLASGTGVNDHNTVGKLRVCFGSNDTNANLKDGEILVVTATNNRMMDAMKRASAIITEEGGMNSHAAIVGLTLDKPVIVGASGATHKLKTGDVISVDSKRGIVRVMPE